MKNTKDILICNEKRFSSFAFRLINGSFRCVFAITLLTLSGSCPAQMVDYFTDKGFGNPIGPLQHPSGEYYKGVTYLAYQGPLEDLNVHDAWYAWFTMGQGNTIIVTYNYHPCLVTGHGTERYNCYYMQMDCEDGSWRNVLGEVLTIPVTKEDADEKTLVYDSGEQRTRIGICRMDEEGNPHLILRQGNLSRIRYYRWTGDHWLGPIDITGLPQSQDGDMQVESPNRIRILLNESDSGLGEVAWWEFFDGGLTWKKGESLIQRPGNKFMIASMILNAHPDARIMVNEIIGVGNSEYKRIFLLGDHGPVTHPL